jgi:hypothetical protein
LWNILRSNVKQKLFTMAKGKTDRQARTPRRGRKMTEMVHQFRTNHDGQPLRQMVSDNQLAAFTRSGWTVAKTKTAAPAGLEKAAAAAAAAKTEPVKTEVETATETEEAETEAEAEADNLSANEVVQTDEQENRGELPANKRGRPGRV